jgi:hypothetical protein
MKWIKTFESYTGQTLFIVDVQKSFSKFFKNNKNNWSVDEYLTSLSEYCKKFNSVYQIWDNHVNGKNVDKDYLYDHEPVQDESDDIYTFNNQIDVIEKRYNYDVDAQFYVKVLDNDVFQQIKKKELEGSLIKGQIFETTEGTIITYIGNNHKWFHCPIKLYRILNQLKGSEVTIVGGADSECLEDIITTANSLGVLVKRDDNYIYKASSYTSMTL